MKAIFLMLILVLSGCNRSNDIWTFSNQIFGTYYVVKVQEDGTKVDKNNLEKEIHAYLKELNLIYSTYEKSSELSLLNELNANVTMQLSNELKNVLVLSKEVNTLTNGAFDITVGPLVNAWGFGPDGIRKKPRQNEINILLNNTGMDKYTLNEDGKISKKIKNLYLDLSAIAKGHAVDKVIELLIEKKFKTAMVEIGGEVRTIGKKDGKDSWKIGIELPTQVRGGGIHKVLPIVDMAIATSGSYRNYRKYGDEIFSHTIDPRSGMPANHQLVSVSILSKDCATADAIATGIMVLGPEKGFQLVEKEGIMAYFLIKKNGQFETLSSSAFNEYLNKVKE